MHVLVKKQTKKKYDEHIFLVYNICLNTVMKININRLRIKYVISLFWKHLS